MCCVDRLKLQPKGAVQLFPGSWLNPIHRFYIAHCRWHDSIVGVLGSDQLHRLYGLAFDDPNLSILMRHREILFGLLGGLIIYAAFRNDLRIIALVAGLVSAGSFALLSPTGSLLGV